MSEHPSPNSNHEIYFHVEDLAFDACARAEYDKELHKHAYYSIYWIQEGEAIHATPYVEYLVEAGSMFLVPPDLEHRMLVPKGCRGKGVFFNRSFTLLNNQDTDPVFQSVLFNHPEFYSIVRIDAVLEARFESLLQYMQQELSATQKYSCTILQSLLLVLLYEAQRLYELQTTELGPQPESPHHTVLEFKQLVNKHYLRRKEVSYYAHELNMSTACLNQTSKKITGRTAGEIIRSRILDEAKRLLLNTDQQAKEIAFALGFDDPAYFHRFFKRYLGSTMGEYRDAVRKKYTNTVV